jgi:putative adenylate-forming enzyme
MSVATGPDALERIRAHAGEFLAHDRRSRQDVLGYQRERFEGLLRHALAHSPYYRETLGTGAAERPLEELPVLPKALLMEHFDDVVTDPRLRRADLEAFLGAADAGAAYLGEYRIFSTAGSSGIPGLFVFSQSEFAHWISVSLTALARVGVTPATRFVAIGAPSAVHVTRQLFAAFQAPREDVPRLAVTTPMEEIVTALNEYRPQAILTYASVLSALADEQLEGNLAIEPQVVISTAEVLTDDNALRIEDAWGIRPMQAYAATEAPPIATGSPEHVGMHVWETSLVLEVVDEDNRPVPTGAPGAKVLLTNLANRTQPLIRYELSDSVVLAEGRDPSGRPWLRIERVAGRSDDVLKLPASDGRAVRVHPLRLRAPFTRLPGVRGYQIVHRPDSVLVRVVPRSDANRDLSQQVRAALAAALSEAGAVIDVRVELVSEIDREPGAAAKIKLVRSEA